MGVVLGSSLVEVWLWDWGVGYPKRSAKSLLEQEEVIRAQRAEPWGLRRAGLRFYTVSIKVSIRASKIKKGSLRVSISL